jgi:hypothetical protein
MWAPLVWAYVLKKHTALPSGNMHVAVTLGCCGLTAAHVLCIYHLSSRVISFLCLVSPHYVIPALILPGSTSCQGRCQHSAANRASAAGQQQMRWQQWLSWRVQTVQPPSQPSCQRGISGWRSSWSRRHKARQGSSRGRCLRPWHRLCRIASHRCVALCFLHLLAVTVARDCQC